jgi:hypothetical protein
MTNASGTELPALNLAAEPGQRLATLELAREIERRGFSGISVASPFGAIGQGTAATLGVHAAMAIGRCGSLAGQNFCPKPEPSVPL